MTPPFQPPLRIDVTWWGEPAGNWIPLPAELMPHALALYSLLCRHVDPYDPVASAFDVVRRPGGGMPVLLGRPLPALVRTPASAVSRRVIIPLLDARAWTLAGAECRDAIATLVGDRQTLVLPISFDPRWNRALQGLQPIYAAGFEPDRRLLRTTTAVAAHLARWLVLPVTRPITVFVSHTHDVAAGIAERLAGHLDAAGLSAFFEARMLARSDRLDERLGQAKDTAVLLSVRTDEYGEDPRCTDEVLAAKRLRMPHLTAWLVTREERRASPYGGNGPIFFWEPDRLDEVARRCLEVWLHHLHFRQLGAATLAAAGVTRGQVVSRPPELVDFATGALPSDRDCVILYPDPPLSIGESRMLRMAQPRAQLATPTTLSGAIDVDDPAPPLAGQLIALSLSHSPDAPAPADGAHHEGFNELHVQDAMARVTLSLVRAGARIGYGGRVELDYTRFLSEMIDRHNRLGAGRAEPPILFVTPDQGSPPSAVVLELRPCPDVEADEKPDVVYALRLAAMRIQMAEDCAARILIGGKVEKFMGRFPGIAEECWRMLEANKPVYVLGGYGGAARMVADALRGEWTHADDPAPPALIAAYERHRPKDEPSSFDELMKRIAAYGADLRGDHLDATWPDNGLTLAENLRLFESTDLDEIVPLILKGLIATRGADARATAAAQRAETRPALRVQHGRIIDVDATGAYAVTVLEGMPLLGAAAAIDRKIGGRIGALPAIKKIEQLDGIPTLAGRSVIVVPVLGHSTAGDESPDSRAREACEALARHVDSQGITSLAVTAFGSDIGLPIAVAAMMILEAIRKHAPGVATLTFCEPNPERYPSLEDTLKREGVVVLPPAPSIESPVRIDVRVTPSGFTTVVMEPDDDATATVPRTDRALTTDERAWQTELVSGRARLGPKRVEVDTLGHRLADIWLTPQQQQILLAHRGRPLDVIHDADASAVPWELLMIADGTAVPHVPARLGGIRRRLLADYPRCVPPRRREPDERLRVLLIIDTDGSLDDAEREGQEIRAMFEQRKDLAEVTPLVGGAATLANVLAALARRQHVLHYAGHSRFDNTDASKGGLKLADGRLTAATLPDGLPIPPLVIFNACETGMLYADDDQDKNQDSRDPIHGVSLTGEILQAGVRAFVGTFWKIDDKEAALFGATLYDRLLAGETLGQAMLAGRRALHASPSVHWANYALYGDSELRF